MDMADFLGTTGDDSLIGTGGDDRFDLTGGGEDTAFGGGGDDRFDLGMSFDTSDRIDGGDGDDIVTLTGRYPGRIVFSADTITGVEALGLFEDGAGEGRFDLVLDDANIAAGASLSLAANAQCRVDASAETDGSLYFSVGSSNDATLIGGALDDIFDLVGRSLDRKLHLDGGGGGDTILAGPTPAGETVKFAPTTITNIEAIEINQPSGATQWLMDDANVAAGQRLSIYGPLVGTGRLLIDAHHETDGSYLMFGGPGDDQLIGGRGDDVLHGVRGDDTLVGGGGADDLGGSVGADHFIYLAPGNSSKRAADTIADLDSSDLIDLQAIDADTTTAGNQAFHLVDRLDGHAGELSLTFSAKTNVTKLSADVNGDGKADLLILLAGDHHDFTGLVL